MDTLEREVLESCRVILDTLEQRGILFWKRIYMGARIQNGYKCKNPNAGMTDCFIFYRGFTGFAELKRPKGGKLDPKQEEFRDLVIQHGFRWALIRNDDDLFGFLTTLGVPWQDYFKVLNKT